MKKFLTVIFCIMLLVGLTACNSTKKLLPEKQEEIKRQAQKITDCFVCAAMTKDAQEICEITDEEIWRFIVGSYSYREDPDFPYPVWPEISEDETAAYFPIPAMQKMVEQVFGESGWLPDFVKENCDQDLTRLSMPLGIGLPVVYGYEKMEAAAKSDGSVCVSLQLIDAPQYPGEKRYGEYEFAFCIDGDEEEIFLRLTHFGPAVAEKH